MDAKTTIAIYDQDAPAFAERHAKQTPTRLYQLVQTFFKRGAVTLDVGSGIGRDTAWLKTNGYPTTGLEPAKGMREIAKQNYPHLEFNDESLPDLKTIASDSAVNVFVCAVLMHVASGDLINTVANLLRITKPQGRLIVSFRHGKDEKDGRLFEKYHPEQIAQLFESLGGKVLFIEQDDIWFNLVIEKSSFLKKDGLGQVQSIINMDKKTASYKFALLRALCEISKYEPHIVSWSKNGDYVQVPMRRIAARWLAYYLPLVRENIKQTSNERMAFEEQLNQINFNVTDMALIKNQIDLTDNEDLEKTLKIIAETIKKGPIQYAGGGKYSIFNFIPKSKLTEPELIEAGMGMLTLPPALWGDIALYAHWIEDSLSIQWAQFTENLNDDRRFAYYLDLITKSTQKANRDTNIIRTLFEPGKKLECVWTGKNTANYEVDHVIPWAIWRNNDVWNLLPADEKENGDKRHRLPAPALIYDRFDTIANYWSLYLEHYSELFTKQIEIGLGLKAGQELTHKGRDAMMNTVIRLQQMTGVEFWEPK